MTEYKIPVNFNILAVEDKLRFFLNRNNLDDYQEYTLEEAIDVRTKLNNAITLAAANAYFKSRQ